MDVFIEGGVYHPNIPNEMLSSLVIKAVKTVKLQENGSLAGIPKE